MDGYKTIQDLSTFNNWTQSYRYKTLKLEKNGEFFLYKQANDPYTAKLLQNEVRFRQFFNKVGVKKVTTTKIVEVGEDYLLYEWLDNATELAKRSPEAMPRLEQNLDKFVDLAVAMDDAGVDYTPETDDSDAIKSESVYGNKIEVAGRLKEIVEVGWIDEARVQRALDLYEKYVGLQVPQYQHGDFTPWHIFVDGNQWLVYDAEHANSKRPRYSDLVHPYLRIAIHCKSPALAAKILSEFIQKSEVNIQQFKERAMSVFVGRSMGNVVDSYNDRKADDYRDQAIMILDKVLEDDINTLTRLK